MATMTTTVRRRPSVEMTGPARIAPTAIPAFAVPDPAESQEDGMMYFSVVGSQTPYVLLKLSKVRTVAHQPLSIPKF